MKIVMVMLCVYCILCCVRYYVLLRISYVLIFYIIMYTVFVALCMAHFPLNE